MNQYKPVPKSVKNVVWVRITKAYGNLKEGDITWQNNWEN